MLGDGGSGGDDVDVDDNTMARRLLERLLEPSQPRVATALKHRRALLVAGGAGAGSMGRGEGGGEALVRGLKPSSVAALMRLQVKK